MIDTTLLVQMLLGALLGLSVYLPLACGQLSLATPGFYAIGGTLAALLSTRVRALGGGESASGSGYPITSLLLEMLLAAVLCGVLANGIGAVVLRLRGIYLTIATIALVEILRVVSLNLEITGGAVGIFSIPQPVADPAGYALFALLLLLDMRLPMSDHVVAVAETLLAQVADEGTVAVLERRARTSVAWPVGSWNLSSR